MSNVIAKPSVPAADIVRCASMELVVTDLAASRGFCVDPARRRDAAVPLRAGG